ncbi:hypothetical protein [Nocardioides sp. YIM 152588]|uniref:hypothetical protein n=1 Tax=Nocardioides sp. YIM 152588 TaxID=3158259 RepID=UPI0032E53143
MTMSSSGPDTADRLRLRPGRAVLRRDAATLQVGLGNDAVRLPDTPAVRGLLDRLEQRHGVGVGADAPDARHALDLLAARGHLVLTGTTPTPVPGEDDPPGADDTPDPPAPVGTVGLLVPDDASRERLDPLLALAGLVPAERDPTAWLVVTPGPVRRGTVDELVRADVPHLLVAGLDETRRVGPFVVPGRTACLRCVDAHEAADDPRRPILLEQAARASERRPAPVDPLQDLTALALAVRDLATFAAGGEPGTWSATIDLPAPADRSGSPRLRRWLRHPYCGCAWDVPLLLP